VSSGVSPEVAQVTAVIADARRSVGVLQDEIKALQGENCRLRNMIARMIGKVPVYSRSMARWCDDCEREKGPDEVRPGKRTPEVCRRCGDPIRPAVIVVMEVAGE